MAIQDLLEAVDRAGLSEDELLQIIAEESRPGLLQADNRSEATKRQAALRWLEQNREKLRSVLCRPELNFLHPQPASQRERALMICAIADFLSGTVTGVSPFTAAALVLWRGLDALCVNE